MLIIISPAKSLNFDITAPNYHSTNPIFLGDSKIIINELRNFSSQQVAKLMKISDKLAQFNYQRFANFQIPFTKENSKPALFVFDGDVYDGIDVENYSSKNLDFAQKHLRILSGLYGVLRPLDLMQAYRLEMSTPLKIDNKKNLYQFWQEKITNYLNQELKNNEGNVLINLASEEYFGVIAPAKLNAQIINIIFKEKKGLGYKIVGIFAKKARGLMVDFIVKNNIKNPEEIKEFSVSGYKFMPEFSDQKNWCFCR